MYFRNNISKKTISSSPQCSHPPLKTSKLPCVVTSLWHPFPPLPPTSQILFRPTFFPSKIANPLVQLINDIVETVFTVQCNTWSANVVFIPCVDRLSPSSCLSRSRSCCREPPGGPRSCPPGRGTAPATAPAHDSDYQRDCTSNNTCTPEGLSEDQH